MRDSQSDAVCPVCGGGLPQAGHVRRCPTCGARILWQRARATTGLGRSVLLQQPAASSQHPSFGVVLFNSRLCGIIAGIEVAMLLLLTSGYRIPLPWGLALSAAALPVIGYLAAGAVAQRLQPEARRGYLIFLMSCNAGLLAALIVAVAAPCGTGILLAIAVGAGVLSARFISSVVPRDSEY